MAKFIIERPSEAESKQVLFSLNEDDHLKVKMLAILTDVSLQVYVNEAVCQAVANDLERDEHLRGMVEHAYAHKGGELVANEAGDFILRAAQVETK